MRSTLVAHYSLPDEYGRSIPDILQSLHMTVGKSQTRNLLLFCRGNVMHAVQGETHAVDAVRRFMRQGLSSIQLKILLNERIVETRTIESGIGHQRLAIETLAKIPPNIPIFSLCKEELNVRVRDEKIKEILVQFL